MIQADRGNVVVAELDTDRVLHLVSEPLVDALVTDLPARDESVIELMKRSPWTGIVQKAT